MRLLQRNAYLRFFFPQGQKASPPCPPTPAELLRQCEEALRDRPPRLHRKFTHLNDGDSGSSSSIRVMQWNILAQGSLISPHTLWPLIYPRPQC